MALEQKITEAKAKKHNQFIKAAFGFISVSLLCALIVLYISFDPFNVDEAEIPVPSGIPETLQNNVSTSTLLAPEVPDKQLRQAYIHALGNYENNIKSELNKIDLVAWNDPRIPRLSSLEDEALSKFSATDYANAVKDMKELNQLAQAMISDSQQAFEQALSKAQNAYDADQYDDAEFQIKNALMLDKTSVEAEILSTKIDTLPEILNLLKEINTAKVENKPSKELNLIKELVKLAPERKTAIERKQILINSINNSNFKSHITQSYQAIEKNNAGKAKLKMSAAKKIFPDRSEVREVEKALQDLEKKQRLATHQKKAQAAMSDDDWIAAKKQLQFALQEQTGDKTMQASLLKATTIIALNNEFEQQIKNPYRLSNKQLSSKMKAKIATASTFASTSPSLDKKTNELSHLIESMNKKITVEISSDNQTNILVRGVGVVGVTSLKTIQLTPGRYTFEGKRKGYKSKLMDVLIPYDQASFSISIRCDEPI